MPIHQTFHTPSGGELTLWKITETLEELLESLPMTATGETEWREISHPKRQREWLAARHLFHHLNITNSIKYLESGKPVLTDGRHISISHSHDLVGVFIHEEKEVGLDIQAPDEKLVKISRRFCNEEELEFAKNSENPLEAFTIMWSAKEAVFKVFGKNIHFAKQMALEPFDLHDKRIKLRFRGENGNYDFQLSLLRIHKYFLILAEKP